MGCFLACFGSSKDCKTRKQRHKVQPRFQTTASYNAQSSTVSLESRDLEKPITPVKDVRDDKAEEQQLGSGSSARKKVTFDTNVKTYEHVSLSVDQSIDFELEKELREDNYSAKPGESETCSDHGSISSSSSSYPPNHRYQNCRESDDEVEEDEDELDYGESELEDDDDDDDDDEYEDLDDGAVESRERICGIGGITEEEVDGLVEEQVQPIGLIRGVRDRAHPVLSPVENLTQWKAVKAKGVVTPFKLQKENLNLEQEEPRLSFSSDPSFKESSFSFRSKSDNEHKKLKQEVSVDASLSNWLSSTETTPVKKNSTLDSEAAASTPERCMSQGSNSIRSPEDRPILGALTLEEINKFSASSSPSPRKSPSRSPDEMPIIGTVGTYWSHESTTKDSGSATSFKGIPNTTSKYREDKKVNWHSTPFETRLVRALNRGSAQACSNPNIC